MSTEPPRQPEPSRDPVLDNLIWLQRTRERRLAEARQLASVQRQS